jgi:hypothetical protein
VLAIHKASMSSRSSDAGSASAGLSHLIHRINWSSATGRADLSRTPKTVFHDRPPEWVCGGGAELLASCSSSSRAVLKRNAQPPGRAAPGRLSLTESLANGWR